MGQAFEVAKPTHATLRALNYSPAAEKFRQKSGHRRCVQLGAKLRLMGPAYGSVFIRTDCAPSHGIELLSQSDMFASEPCGRVIRQDSLPEPDQHVIRKWQILIAGAGTLGETELYGRSIIADERLAGKFVGPDAMVLEFEDPESDESLYIYAFLASQVGVQAVRSTSYGTKILRLRSDLLATLPIPFPDEHITSRIAALVRKSVRGREFFSEELRAARQLIEDLPEFREVLSMGVNSARRRQCIAWSGPLQTMGAWNHASLGEALAYLRSKWSMTMADRLAFNGLFNGPRFVRVPCAPSNGIEFMSQRDVFMMRPVVRRIARPPVPDRLLFVDNRMLLVGSHGQLVSGSLFGRVEAASSGFERAALTQDILRISFDSDYWKLAYAYLSTDIGLALLRSTAIGTSIPSMHLDLVASLPLPEIDTPTADRIKTHVENSISARLAANAAEAEAVRIVEQEVLPAWLA